MKRILSDPTGLGGAREGVDAVGESKERLEPEIVVLRWECVVSAEGGGGRFICAAERKEARHRKHSPVP